MIWLFPLVIILLLLAFYVWMFHDMVNNDKFPSTTGGPFRWPPVSKYDWTVVFIFLNIVAAGYYYFTEYTKG